MLSLELRSSGGRLYWGGELVIGTPQVTPSKAQKTLAKLDDAAHRAGPESVVDRARDVAQWCIGSWLAEQAGDPKLRQADLGQLVANISERDSGIIRAVAAALARLHSRAKPNEQERYNSRTITEDDAEYSLAAIGLLLREPGWNI